MKSTQLESQPVNEVLSRQESAHIPAPLQAAPDPKETPQDQGTSLIADDAPTVELQALDSSEISGIQLALLLGRARYFVASYQAETEEEEEVRSELLDEIDAALGTEKPQAAIPTITNGRPEDWDDEGAELPF